MKQNLKLLVEDDLKTRDCNKPRGIIQWIDFYQKNKPQTNALCAGIMIMVFSGQHLGWGIFNNHLKSQPWAGGYEDDGTVFWAIISWFISSIAGFFIAAVVVNKYSKISIYVFSSVLALISASMFMLYPQSIYYIVLARILAGLSNGIAYPTVLIHASEVSIPKLRGMIVASIPFSIMVGVFTTSSSLFPVLKTRNYELDPTKSIGMNGLIIISVGLFIAVFFNRESPVFLIRKYREQEAVNIMVRLRSESHETAEIRNEFNEFKLMVVEDGQSNVNIFGSKNRWPLFVVVAMKIIFVASFNLPLNLMWLEAMETQVYNGETDSSGMLLSGTRWVVMIVMSCFIDKKRTKFFKISCLLSGMILLLLDFSLSHPSDALDQWTKTAIAAGSFQLSSGFALGSLADVYATESFNTKKKPLSIAFASSLEFLLQILLVSMFYYSDIATESLMEILGGVFLLGAIFAFFIPDTSGLTLREARIKFLNKSSN